MFVCLCKDHENKKNCLIWTCRLSGLIEVCIRNGVVIWDFKTPVGEKISKMKIKIN